MGDGKRSDLDLQPDEIIKLLDAVSLDQALRDFEVANGRVVDLTQRLITVTGERRLLQTELEILRLQAATWQATSAKLESVEQELAAERQTKSYQLVRALRSLHRRLG